MTTYLKAVAWIAKHEPHQVHQPRVTDGEPLAQDVVINYQSVAMVSDLFGVDAGIVAQDVCAAHRSQRPRRRQLTIAQARRES